MKRSDFLSNGKFRTNAMLVLLWGLWFGVVIYSRPDQSGHIDARADVPPAFVDITRANVTVSGGEIVATINLLSLPAMLAYNSPALPDNVLEYNFAVYFDVDGDGSPANDLALSIAHFKFPGSEPGHGRLLDFAQRSLFKVDETGRQFEHIAGIDAAQRGRSLTVSVNKEVYAGLVDIGNTTPFRVLAHYNDGASSVFDYLPDGRGYTKGERRIPADH